MKQDDLASLSSPYKSAHDSRRGIAHALGVHLPMVDELYKAVLADLDPSGGVRWWTPPLDLQRSCLIAEHLTQCIWSVQYNLTEAGIHIRELEDWAIREAEAMRRSVFVRQDGTLGIGRPPSRTPMDDLREPMVDLHTGGFLRAIGSALDCIGAAIVGVLALEVDLLKSDFSQARKALKPYGNSSSVPSLPVSFARDLDLRLDTAGPAAWWTWALEYRNMFVHRARRLQPSALNTSSHILGPDGRPILRTDLVRHLPRDPGWSEAQAWVWQSQQRPFCLTEDARTTLEGVKVSAVQFLDGVGSDLLGIWSQRRATPELLKQPSAQWKQVHPQRVGNFAGYAPGSAPYAPSAFASNQDTVRRLMSGNVFDDLRSVRWPLTET